MVKNTIGGKHHKRQKKANEPHDGIRDFPWADNEVTFFGKVITLFGGNMVEVKIGEGLYKTRIPGSFRKRVWIGKGDMVLVHYDGGCNVYEITYVYRSQEVDIIRSTGVYEDNIVEDDGNENILFTTKGGDDIDVDQI
jgi:initiation factor 1A